VKCEIRIISGARQGVREIIDKPYIGLGRHPMSDVRFDAEQDIDASTRHAAIILDGGRYILRDLGSTNGTFVSGERLTGDVVLKDGDVIRCGVHGPELGFAILRDQEEMVMEAVKTGSRIADRGSRSRMSGMASPATPAAPAAPRATSGGQAPSHRDPQSAPRDPSGPSKTSILRAEMALQKSRFRAVTAFLLIVLVGSGSVLVWTNRQTQLRQLAAEARADSLLRYVGQMQAAKRDADSVIASYRAALVAETDARRRTVIQAQMSSAIERRGHIERTIASADEMDYTGILRRNARGVAVLFIEFEGEAEQFYTGTGFNVAPDGRLLTNRHVVAGARGERRASRVAVKFHGSEEVLRAHVVRVSPTSDVALVQIDERGPFPVVAGLDPDAAPAAGSPVVLLGFPGYGDPNAVPNATLITGNVIELVTDSLLRLDAFSGVGASGSPVLDRSGRVVGIMFGGEGTSGASRTIHALPIRRAMALLNN
jgi:S1-C subfamily serine protease